MCDDCGCSHVGKFKISSLPHGVGSSEHARPHMAEPTSAHRTLTLGKSVLEKNDRQAQRNREFFKAKGLLVLNIVSAPGSGKTTLVQKTATALKSRLRTAVIVGDLATDNDAARLRAADVPAVQITTGTVCHLDSDMVMQATAKVDVDSLDLLIIENVGNLVCPASYDLGENLRVVLLSAAEGEDKPLKYPPMFHSADVVIVNKIDLAEACEFDREKALINLRKISHHARIFEVSARKGNGIEEWCSFLIECHKSIK